MIRKLSHSEVACPPALANIPGVSLQRNRWKIPNNTRGILGLLTRQVFNPAARPALHPLFYEWVGEYLLPYQRETAHYCASSLAFHNWSVTGSGKTLAGLVALTAQPGPKLVIYPGQVRPQWAEQIRKYMRREPMWLTGKRASLIGKPDPDAIYAINMEVFPDWEQELLKVPWRLLVDEEDMYKDKRRGSYVVKYGEKVFVPGDNRSAVLRRLSEASSWYCGMTGTPVGKEPIDIWGILDIAEPWCWGSRHDFGMYYLGGEQKEVAPGRVVWSYGSEIKAGKLAQMRLRLKAVSYRVTQKAMPEMPGLRFEFPSLSAAEQNRPLAFAKQFKEAAKEGNVYEAKLREASTRKLKYIKFRVEQACKADQHVIIFTGRHDDTEWFHDQLRKYLSVQGLGRVPIEYAHGGIDPDERWMRRTRNQEAEGAAVLIVTGDSVGVGWDFQRTDLAIFAFLPPEPRRLVQWLGRFPRLGQDRPCCCVFVIAEGTVDEGVYGTMLKRLPAVSQVVDEETLGVWQREYEESEDAELLKGLMRTGLKEAS